MLALPDKAAKEVKDLRVHNSHLALGRLNIRWSLVALVFVVGCAGGEKPGGAHHMLPGGVTANFEQPGTPKESSSQETHYEFFMPVPAGSKIWIPGAVVGGTNTGTVELAGPTEMRIVSRAVTTVGGSWLDRGREVAATIKALNKVLLAVVGGGFSLIAGGLAMVKYGWPKLGILGIICGAGMIVCAMAVPMKPVLALGIFGGIFAVGTAALLIGYYKGREEPVGVFPAGPLGVQNAE